MRRSSFAALPIAALAAGLLVGSAQPSYAAGETWKVVSVEQTGCEESDIEMTVHFGGIRAVGGYVAHTQVRSGGLVYMNEDAGSPVDGNQGWSLYGSFTYRSVPNPGTWPLPEDQQVSADFRLERPKGSVVYSWTLVLESCNSGKVLYDGPTAKDKDKDFVPTPQDRCPTLSEPDRANGCPLRERSLSLEYAPAKEKFVGRLTAGQFKTLSRHRDIVIWAVSRGPDTKIGKATTARTGTYVLKADAKRGRYYATTSGAVVARQGQALKETSPTVRVG